MGHADTLLAMGGAFLAAAFLARLGGRIGLPTIPLFMLAGILLGPHTPGFVLVEDAHDFEMLSALGLVLLLFYLGLEFHLDDLKSGGKRLLTAGGIYLLLNVGAGLGFGSSWAGACARPWCSPACWAYPPPPSSPRSSSTSADRPPGNPSDPGRHRRRGHLPGAVPGRPATGHRGRARRRGHGPAGRQGFGFLLVLAAAARYGTRLVGPPDRHPGQRTARHQLPRRRGPRRRGLRVLGVATPSAPSWSASSSPAPLRSRIRELVHPLRDAFAAIFFFAFGLAIDPGDIASVAGPVARRRS